MDSTGVGQARRLTHARPEMFPVSGVGVQFQEYGPNVVIGWDLDRVFNYVP